MAAGIEVISRWMLVVRDMSDHREYPVFIASDKEYASKRAAVANESMQRIMKSYDLNGSLAYQIGLHDANFSPDNPCPKPADKK